MAPQHYCVLFLSLFWQNGCKILMKESFLQLNYRNWIFSSTLHQSAKKYKRIPRYLPFYLPFSCLSHPIKEKAHACFFLLSILYNFPAPKKKLKSWKASCSGPRPDDFLKPTRVAKSLCAPHATSQVMTSAPAVLEEHHEVLGWWLQPEHLPAGIFAQQFGQLLTHLAEHPPREIKTFFLERHIFWCHG